MKYSSWDTTGGCSLRNIRCLFPSNIKYYKFTITKPPYSSSIYLNCVFRFWSFFFTSLHLNRKCCLSQIFQIRDWDGLTYFWGPRIIFLAAGLCMCVYAPSVKKKRTIYFNLSYCTEIKMVPIIMDYCLFQFDSLKFFFYMGSLYLTSIFFNVNPQIFQRNRKVHLSNCQETNFHNISNINLIFIRHRNYS